MKVSEFVKRVIVPVVSAFFLAALFRPLCMVLLMLPAFLFAMYEKDGMPLEKVLLNIINVKLKRPAVRRYEIKNIYEMEERKNVAKQKKGGGKHGKKKKRR